MAFWTESEILKNYGFKPPLQVLEDLIVQHSIQDDDGNFLNPAQLFLPPSSTHPNQMNTSEISSNEIKSNLLWHPLHLPKFHRPAKHVEIISEKRVSKLNKSLSSIQASTENLNFVLESLQNRLVDLSTRLASIHLTSQNMTKRNASIEKELTILSTYIDRFDLVASLPQHVDKGFVLSSHITDPVSSVDKYFDSLRQIEDLLLFFEANSFKGKHETISFLEKLLKRGINYCVTSFTSFIRISSEPAEFLKLYPPQQTHTQLYEYLEFASAVIHGSSEEFEFAIRHKITSPFSSPHSISLPSLNALATVIQKLEHYHRLEYSDELLKMRILFLTESLSFIDPWTSEAAFAFAFKQDSSRNSKTYETRSIKGDSSSRSPSVMSTKSGVSGVSRISNESEISKVSGEQSVQSVSSGNQSSGSSSSYQPEAISTSNPDHHVDTTFEDASLPPAESQNTDENSMGAGSPRSQTNPSSVIGPSLSSFLATGEDDLFDDPFVANNPSISSSKSPNILNIMKKSSNRPLSGVGSTPSTSIVTSSKSSKTSKSKMPFSMGKPSKPSKPKKFKPKKRSFSGASFGTSFAVPQNNNSLALNRASSYSSFKYEPSSDISNPNGGNGNLARDVRDRSFSGGSSRDISEIYSSSKVGLNSLEPLDTGDNVTEMLHDHQNTSDDDSLYLSPRSSNSPSRDEAELDISHVSDAAMVQRRPLDLSSVSAEMDTNLNITNSSPRSFVSSESSNSLKSSASSDLFGDLQLPTVQLKQKRRISLSIPRLSPRSVNSNKSGTSNVSGSKSGLISTLASSSPRKTISKSFSQNVIDPHRDSSGKVVVKKVELADISSNPFHALGIWSSANWKNLETEAISTLDKIIQYERPDRTRAASPPGDYPFIYFLSTVALSLYSERQFLLSLLPRKIFTQIFSQISTSIVEIIGEASDTLLQRLASGERHPKENIFGMLYVLDHFYRMDPLFRMIFSPEPTFITPDDIYSVNSVDDRSALLSQWKNSIVTNYNLSFSGTDNSTAYQDLLLTISKCQATTERTLEDLVTHLTSLDPKTKIKSPTVTELTINTLAICKTLLSFKSILGKVHSLSSVTPVDTSVSDDSPISFSADDSQNHDPRTPLVGINAHESLSHVLYPLRNLLLQILDGVLSHLEAKAENTKVRDPILASLYLLNNYQHILQTLLFHVEFDNITNSHFHTFIGVLGQSVLSNLTKRIDFAENQYIRSAFRHLFGLLELPNGSNIGNSSSSTNNSVKKSKNYPAQISKSERHQIKDKFTAINTAFESLAKKHDLYVVNNTSLQTRISNLSTSLISPKYAKFLEYYNTIPFTQNRSKYLKYTVEQCNNIIMNFLSNH